MIKKIEYGGGHATVSQLEATNYTKTMKHWYYKSARNSMDEGDARSDAEPLKS
jgi:hypothetical protein